MLSVWYHGYEVRDYRRLRDNFSTDELALRGDALDELNRTRFDAAKPIFEDPQIAVVFVSDVQRRNSELDVGAQALNVHIIPNHINTDLFRPRVRRPNEARSLLLMRSFASANYGNDIAIESLRILSPEKWFNSLNITIRGFGALFHRTVEPLRPFSNVTIEEKYSSPIEMAVKHYDHGVFLCPTRYDTQGVMLGEAMASGMVTVTHPVAAIPEFTDEHSSLLPTPGDPVSFAEAIRYIVDNPLIMPVLSERAAERVAAQCGKDATIGREIALIRGLG
ncbi:glycosyltransferase family 4 protein [Tessaracoccus sp. MC1865]|uniref:glycosyltransferase n=1 Tax=Tessaracoccus sp. MC1865 TaxID=2760310 RepID=UPI001600E943|nr:glycosyltransferase [Tessaracoccus sp. MC1865]MBB1482824.1 glycosyltransferase family 4 protein [Tessaracoccus sp. MC1865]QTO37736.1 glycosyltransferase family 4 protein [Tessaracoccus sp. MC1865]